MADRRYFSVGSVTRVVRKALAAKLRITTGAVTALLDPLASAGYVERVRDDADRRRIFVRLTEEARRRAWEVFGPIVEDGRRLLEGANHLGRRTRPAGLGA